MAYQGALKAAHKIVGLRLPRCGPGLSCGFASKNAFNFCSATRSGVDKAKPLASKRGAWRIHGENEFSKSPVAGATFVICPAWRGCAGAALRRRCKGMVDARRSDETAALTVGSLCKKRLGRSLGTHAWQMCVYFRLCVRTYGTMSSL